MYVNSVQPTGEYTLNETMLLKRFFVHRAYSVDDCCSLYSISNVPQVGPENKEGEKLPLDISS